MDLVMTSITIPSVNMTEMTVVVLMSRSNIAMTAFVLVSIHLLSKHILSFGLVFNFTHSHHTFTNTDRYYTEFLLSDFRCSSTQDCSGHGICNQETRKCECNDNWDTMQDCSGKLCL